MASLDATEPGRAEITAATTVALAAVVAIVTDIVRGMGKLAARREDARLLSQSGGGGGGGGGGVRSAPAAAAAAASAAAPETWYDMVIETSMSEITTAMKSGADVAAGALDAAAAALQRSSSVSTKSSLHAHSRRTSHHRRPWLVLLDLLAYVSPLFTLAMWYQLRFLAVPSLRLPLRYDIIHNPGLASPRAFLPYKGSRQTTSSSSASDGAAAAGVGGGGGGDWTSVPPWALPDVNDGLDSYSSAVARVQSLSMSENALQIAMSATLVIVATAVLRRMESLPRAVVFGRAIFNALPIIIHYAFVMMVVTFTVGFMGHVLFAHKEAKFSTMFGAVQELMLTMLDASTVEHKLRTMI